LLWLISYDDMSALACICVVLSMNLV
jgi:hypothetical protein